MKLMRSRQDIITWICLGVLTIASVNVILQYGYIVYLESKAPVHHDYIIYQIVGRGILNSLQPYIDIFESKPPGMFLLAAVSILLTGGHGFMTLLHILFLLCIPVIAIQYSQKNSSQGLVERIATGLTAGVFSMVLLQYLSDRAGSLQTESFGAYFAIMYVYSCLYLRGKLQAIVGALAMILAIGVKETFLPILLCCALLLCRNWKHFYQIFILPVSLAAIGGLVIVCVFGFFDGYWNVYLHEMFFSRIHDQTSEPIFIRTLAIHRIFLNLTDYASSILLGYVLALIWICIPALQYVETMRLGKKVLSVMVIIASYFVGRLSYSIGVMYILLFIKHADRITTVPSIFTVMCVLVSLLVIGILYSIYILYRDNRDACIKSCYCIAAIFLLSFSIGLGGGYNDYHYGLGVPVYFTLLMIVIDYCKNRRMHISIACLLSSIAIMGLFLQNRDQHIQYLKTWTQNNYIANKDHTNRMNTLLEKCDVDQYVIGNSFAKFGYVQKSPIGPIMIDSHDYLPNNHPLRLKTKRNIYQHAEAYFQSDESGITNRHLTPYIDEFIEVIPECASDILPINGMNVFFRKGKFDMQYTEM